MKQIKTSKRGLTFSSKENENFPIGGHFTYVVDIKGGTVLLSRMKPGRVLFRKGRNAILIPD